MTILTKPQTCRECGDCNSKSEIFRLLTREEAIILNEDRFEVHFKTGENITKQGTNLTHIINLISGYAKVYIEGINERNLLLKLVGPNTLMEGPGIFTDQRFHFSVTALEPCSVCFINVENFKKVLAMNKDVNNKFLEHLSTKRAMMYEKLISLTQKQMHGKIADAIIYLSEDIFKNTEFDLPLSRQDLADMTAMSKDSAIRILKEFEKDGILKISGRKISIPRMELLKDIAARG